MTIAVDLGRKATKQTNNFTLIKFLYLDLCIIIIILKIADKQFKDLK